MIFLMDLRDAHSPDLPFLAYLIEQLGYPSQKLGEVLEHYLNDPRKGVWVVELEKRIVGTLAYDVLEQFHGGGLLFRIVSLVVDRESRRKGVGARLLRRAEEEARKNGCEAIELTSALWRNKEGSHDFYRSLGYVDSGICGKCYFRKEINWK